jgi:uncharacterized protein (UPF0332 family)
LAEEAISRAYYATRHATKAALLVHDVIAASHAAVRRLFGQVLVVAEGVEREWAQILTRGHDQRGTAEDNVEFAWMRTRRNGWCVMRGGLWNAWQPM